VGQLGRLDIVSGNAGIVSYGRAEELAEQTWQDTIDVDLTEAFTALDARGVRCSHHDPHRFAAGSDGPRGPDRR
jgi:NAD(P)-dependent dehydrogenase (short-subunit alcohol dehydrogenase family)